MAEGRVPPELAGRPQIEVPDLSQLKAPREISPEQLEQMEVQYGMRCTGCRKRIKRGFKFVAFQARLVDGMEAVLVGESYACDRAECGFFLTAARDAHAVHAIEWEAFMDDPGVQKILGIGSPEDVAGGETKEETDVPARPGDNGAAEGSGAEAEQAGATGGDGSRD